MSNTPLNLEPQGAREVWPFAVDWSKPYQIRYEFKTEIYVSRSGREQRSARRHSPRKRLEWRMVADGELLRRYKDLLWFWQPRDLVVPELTRRVSLPALWPAGSVSLDLTAAPDWLQPKGAVVVGDGVNRETLSVDSRVGDTITFQQLTQQSWPAGTRLYPGLVGNLPGQVSADRVTRDVATASVEFIVRPLSEVPRTPPAADLTFNGREVFLTRANWAAAVDSTLGHEVDELDYGTGPITRYIAVPFGVEITSATYVCEGQAQADALLDLFLRLRGQQGEAYLPTWEADFVLSDNVSAGSDRFPVAGTRLAERYDGRTTHQAIFVRLTDGTLLLRRVLGITVVGDDSEIVVDSPWPVDLTPSTVALSGWLLARRLASDSLTVEWLTGGVAQVQLGWITVEDLEGV